MPIISNAAKTAITICSWHSLLPVPLLHRGPMISNPVGQWDILAGGQNHEGFYGALAPNVRNEGVKGL